MTNTKNARVLILAPINRDGYFGGATRKVVKRLTPTEFSTYKLQKNEEVVWNGSISLFKKEIK